jgi:hypothetical protein
LNASDSAAAGTDATGGASHVAEKKRKALSRTPSKAQLAAAKKANLNKSAEGKRDAAAAAAAASGQSGDNVATHEVTTPVNSNPITPTSTLKKRNTM